MSECDECEFCGNPDDVKNVDPEGKPLPLCWICRQEYKRVMQINRQINEHDAYLEELRNGQGNNENH